MLCKVIRWYGNACYAVSTLSISFLITLDFRKYLVARVNFFTSRKYLIVGDMASYNNTFKFFKG